MTVRARDKAAAKAKHDAWEQMRRTNEAQDMIEGAREEEARRRTNPRTVTDQLRALLRRSAP